MALWSKIRGTIETIFQVGLGGPQLKNNSGAVEVRNSGDSAFALLRALSPVNDNDVATKQYVDTIASPTIVTSQFDGNNTLPTNSTLEKFYVVSSTGSNATIGQLLWDDGSNTGTVTVLAAAARMIVTTQALVGGTATFKADTPYVWDVASTSWVNAGGSALSGCQRTIRMALTNAASQSSASQIPANAVVAEVAIKVVTPYSAGATLIVGQTGSTSLLAGTTDNLATVAGTYLLPLDTGWGASALAVLVTVAGAPAAGAGFCIVRYSIPDA